MSSKPQVYVPPEEETNYTYKDLRRYITDRDARDLVKKRHADPSGYSRLGTVPHLIKGRLLDISKGKPLKTEKDVVKGVQNADFSEAEGVLDTIKKSISGEAGIGADAYKGAAGLSSDVQHAFDNNVRPEEALADEATKAIATARRRDALIRGDLPLHKYPSQMFRDYFLSGTEVKKKEDGTHVGKVNPINSE